MSFLSLFDTVTRLIDRTAEQGTRRTAQRLSRRSAFTRLGTLVIGGTLVPVLPFDRSGRRGAALAATNTDDTTCEYWRYCALDGFLCSCCGGSVSQCPPGAKVSSVTWVGTCQNPNDNRAYLISYNDCCAKSACARCLCNYNERERPAYSMGVHNDINWCMADTDTAYHCTVAAVVGVGDAG